MIDIGLVIEFIAVFAIGLAVGVVMTVLCMVAKSDRNDDDDEWD